MLFINKLFNSIACLLYFINLQLVIPGRTWILLYLGRTVYKCLWACMALYVLRMITFKIRDIRQIELKERRRLINYDKLNPDPNFRAAAKSACKTQI